MQAEVREQIATAVATALTQQANQAAAAAAAAAQVHHVAFKMPDFWVGDPDMWFVQAEMSFDVSRINRSYTKYQHIVSKLPEAVMLSCRSLVGEINPDTVDAYEQLRDHLTTAFGKTRWQRAFAILDHPDLGDRRPSAMMTQMLALLPHGTAPELLFFAHFMRRLPASMRDQLAAANHKTAAAMAEHADCIWDARAAKDSVSVVTDSVDAVLGRSSPQNRRRSPDRRQPIASRPQRSDTPHSSLPDDDSHHRDDSPSPYCYYHRKFGIRATRCRGPCTWVPGN